MNFKPKVIFAYWDDENYPEQPKFNSNNKAFHSGWMMALSEVEHGFFTQLTVDPIFGINCYIK